jgi:hypothetical protein
MNALPLAPPADSWHDAHEPATEPDASPAPFTRGLDLTRTPEVLSCLAAAERMTAANQHDRARVYASTALVQLARILGMDARGVELIELMLPQDDVPAAEARGAIVSEARQ